MPFWPDSYETQHEMRTRTPDGRDIVFLSGYAVFNFKGSGGVWRHDDLYMQIGPIWRRIDDVTPVVSLASISNKEHAVNAGWAVDNCRWTTMGNRILLQCRLAIRDVDGYIHRVAYQVNAMGQI